MKKSLFALAVLSLATFAFAGTKKYDISLTTPTKAGSVELAPGNYKVQVKGDQATFTDSKNKSVSVPVKVETAKAKFNATAVESSEKSGQQIIEAIDLGGTTTKVEFAN